MSTVAVEDIIAQVNQLPATERQKVIEALTRHESGGKDVAADSADEASQPGQSAGTVGGATIILNGEIPPARIVSIGDSFNDRAREYQWLKEHRREYIGQWVALEGDQLIAHGNNAKEVFEKADFLGVELPLVLLVEDPDVPFAGF